jgi:hypothetical protein
MASRYAATFRAEGDAVDVLKAWARDSSYNWSARVIELRFETAEDRDTKLKSIWAIEHRKPLAVFEID